MLDAATAALFSGCLRYIVSGGTLNFPAVGYVLMAFGVILGLLGLVGGRTVEPLAAGDPRQVGGYRLRARLGAGGMGQVFLGYSPAGRAVAVKVIHR
jgi:hypothetical protein